MIYYRINIIYIVTVSIIFASDRLIMDTLPLEINYIIYSYFIDYKDLLSLKNVCKEYYASIDKNLILKLKLENKSIFDLRKKPILNKCVNCDCYNETRDIFVNYYREYSGRYIHEHQRPINYDTIYINKNCISVFSPYCCECFKKYILQLYIPSDTGENKYYDHLTEGFVDIDFL